MGIKSNHHEATIKVLNNTREELDKSFSVKNKISIASIDATKQNIMAWNEHSNAFVDLNKSIVSSIIPSLNPKT